MPPDEMTRYKMSVHSDFFTAFYCQCELDRQPQPIRNRSRCCWHLQESCVFQHPRPSFFCWFCTLKRRYKRVLPWLFLIFRNNWNDARVFLKNVPESLYERNWVSTVQYTNQGYLMRIKFSESYYCSRWFLVRNMFHQISS